jgi:hypothetical protein
LAVAATLPFLRFKKPQSPYLSRILRQKLDQKQKRFDLSDRLEEMIVEGQEEEEWEGNVGDEMRQEGLRGVDEAVWEDEEEEWGSVEENERREVERRLIQQSRREKVIGEIMVGIMREERRLWEKERGERRRATKRARWERRERREGKK